MGVVVGHICIRAPTVHEASKPTAECGFVADQQIWCELVDNQKNDQPGSRCGVPRLAAVDSGCRQLDCPIRLRATCGGLTPENAHNDR